MAVRYSRRDASSLLTCRDDTRCQPMESSCDVGISTKWEDPRTTWSGFSKENPRPSGRGVYQDAVSKTFNKEVTMHSFERYYRHLAKGTPKEVKAAKKKFLSKYHPWIRRVFITLETLINEIDFKDGMTLTYAEVTHLGKILAEMEDDEPEVEIDGMLIAIKKLSALQVRIWTRYNKAL